MEFRDLDEILPRLKDFEVCNVVSRAVEDRYGSVPLRQWLDAIPLPHKVVNCAWSTTAFIECEGLARFLATQVKHRAYSDSLKILGLVDLAKCVKSLLDLCSPDLLGNPEVLTAQFGPGFKVAKVADAVERQLFLRSADVEAHLAKYIRARKSEFEALLPEIRKRAKQIKLPSKS